MPSLFSTSVKRTRVACPNAPTPLHLLPVWAAGMWSQRTPSLCPTISAVLQLKVKSSMVWCGAISKGDEVFGQKKMSDS